MRAGTLNQQDNYFEFITLILPFRVNLIVRQTNKFN